MGPDADNATIGEKVLGGIAAPEPRSAFHPERDGVLIFLWEKRDPVLVATMPT
jgi:hypothetical protein